MKGICFTEHMFHAVVNGQKIQTRRIIKGESVWPPKYRPGEKVYLKEPYAETCDEFGSPLVAYKFDNAAFYLIRKDENGDYVELNTIKKPASTNWTINNFPACGEWKNKLFMPEWAARYFIEITAVRAERLQDISTEDCLKEGVTSQTIDTPYMTIWWFECGIKGDRYYTAKDAYAALIDKINGKGTWDKNPFVWVYDFKLIQSN